MNKSNFCSCMFLITTEVKDGFYYCGYCKLPVRCAFKFKEETGYHKAQQEHPTAGLFVCNLHTESVKEVTPFECGCVLTCEFIEGEKTATLEACDDENCVVRKTVIGETKARGKELIFGRKDILQ